MKAQDMIPSTTHDSRIPRIIHSSHFLTVLIRETPDNISVRTGQEVYINTYFVTC